jgi:GNAT superfamily N-acetyltransferase
MLELRERDFPAFFVAPEHAYGRESPFVSLFDQDLRRFLDPRKNPLLQAGRGALTFFTAHRDGRPVGRITAHAHDASNRRHGWNRSCFGFFDCVDDPEVAALLLGAAERWGRERGHDEIRGNFNLTAMAPAGVVTEGFDEPPYSDQLWNPPHVPRLLEQAGYTRDFPMSQFEIDVAAIDLEAMVPPAYRALRTDPRFSWERVEARGLHRLLPQICDAFNDGFEKNPMFVPLTHEEFHFQAKDLTWVIDPRISSIVREGGEIVGLLLCIPDLNPLLRACRSRFGPLTLPRLLLHRRRCRRAVVIIQGVRQRWQHQGLGAVMIREVMGALREAGYASLGVTWIADENVASLRGAMRGGARRMHRLHLYKKALR